MRSYEKRKNVKKIVLKHFDENHLNIQYTTIYYYYG